MKALISEALVSAIQASGRENSFVLVEKVQEQGAAPDL